MIINISPLTNPVAIFTLIICIILIIPYISKKIKVPSILGLILAGLIIGPKGSGLLQSNEGVSIFATVGLLYIMFLAGLEINLNSFLKNKNKSLFFGACTFFIPLILGFAVLYYLLKFNFLPALLISSMFSTHTLLSYPIASRLNITRREAVVITIGGTIITDTAVLILLSLITTAYEGKLNGFFFIQLTVLLIIFVVLVLWGLPKVARWYFNTIQSDNTQQYVFVLVSLFLSATLARIAGIEPIVGAFLSGLALNRVIPQDSPLFNRTTFIGNAIFIPFFLISVGMLIDLKILFSGIQTIFLSIILISVAISGKYMAAYITQKVFKYSRADRHLIFGLSSSHAAATIAVILVGFQLGIIDEKVLNGTILLILITCMISSFVTESAGRIVAVAESDTTDKSEISKERVLVSVSNPETFKNLIDIALLTTPKQSETIIYPLSIVNDDTEAQDSIVANSKIMEQFTAHTEGSDISIVPVTRIEINVQTGITRAIKELFINKVIVGWSGRSSTINYFFGNIIDDLLENAQQMVMVVKVNKQIVKLSKIVVVVPTNADREIGFIGWINTVIGLSKNTGGKILFMADAFTNKILKKRLKEYNIFSDDNFIIFDYYPNFAALPLEISDLDILFVIAARPSTLSFYKRTLVIPKLISRFGTEHNFILLYPEQVELPKLNA